MLFCVARNFSHVATVVTLAVDKLGGGYEANRQFTMRHNCDIGISVESDGNIRTLQ